MVKILVLGDIFGRPGREIVKKYLPELKAELKPDLTIANAENLSGGKGFLVEHIEDMQKAGIDFFTSGNHVWRQKKSLPKLDDPNFPLIRPANYPPGAPGKGFALVTANLMKKVLVINLMGQVFMPVQVDSPFHAANRILELTKNEHLDAIIIDFHAEVTSEKWALGHHLDGKVSFIYGTHTHVPTADARVLSGGTAFITDVGMTGPYDSIIGLEKKSILKQFVTQLPAQHEVAENDPHLNAVFVTIDEKTRLASGIKLIQHRAQRGFI